MATPSSSPNVKVVGNQAICYLHNMQPCLPEQATLVKIVDLTGNDPPVFAFPIKGGRPAHVPADVAVVKEWQEELHPRDGHGRFGEAGGGATGLVSAISAHGGFSVKVLGKPHDPPVHGYMVAFKPQATMNIPINTPKAKLVSTIRSYIKANAADLKQDGVFLGGWRDDADGIIALDISKYTDNKDEAVSLGKQYDQLAVYELHTGTSIPTGGGGGLQKAAGSPVEIVYASALDLDSDQDLSDFVDAILGGD